MKDNLAEIIVVIVIILVICGGGIGSWVFKSMMEAQTYTELTGKKVTTYQALWVDLRVVEPAKVD